MYTHTYNHFIPIFEKDSWRQNTGILNALPRDHMNAPKDLRDFYSITQINDMWTWYVLINSIA